MAYGHVNTRIFVLYFDDACLWRYGCWRWGHIPSMSGVSMLLDLLERTLELPSKSTVVTQPYLDFLTHQYQLSHNGVHGIEHWLRVTLRNAHINLIG